MLIPLVVTSMLVMEAAWFREHESYGSSKAVPQRLHLWDELGSVTSARIQENEDWPQDAVVFQVSLCQSGELILFSCQKNYWIKTNLQLFNLTWRHAFNLMQCQPLIWFIYYDFLQFYVARACFEHYVHQEIESKTFPASNTTRKQWTPQSSSPAGGRNNLMNSSGSSISDCEVLSLEAKNALGNCCVLSVIYHSTVYRASPFPWMTSPSSNISTNIWKKIEKHMACSTSLANCFSRKHVFSFTFPANAQS